MESNIVELDAYGFTVIENALQEITDQLAEAVRVAEKANREGPTPPAAT